jgi:CubicO group peptidase (beta-lactamase class C family)
MNSFKKHLLSLVVLAGFPGSLRADPVDDYVNSEIARQQAPGLSLTVLRHGQIARTQGYGLANLEHSVPVHPDTLFKVGAVSMQFTAAGIMLLVEDGKIGLDDSIRKYLPEAPKSWAPVTIRQMLNHTSGLPATPNGEFGAEYSQAELLGIIYKEELNFAAGTRWRFSYVDYLLLGVVMQRVTGEHYSDFLTKRLFRPLGMQTARQISDLDIIPNRAAGYELRDGKLRNAEAISAVANSTADGSLYLSALDYAAWEAAIANRKLLKPESWALIGQPAKIASGRDYPYGFGWYLEKSGDQLAWRHSGSWQGFQSFVLRYPADDLTVVALANGEGADPARIARHVAAMLEPKLAQAPGAPIEDREPQVTIRVKTLLVQIADGKTSQTDFAYFAKLDYTELTGMYRGTLSSLGTLQDIALVDRNQLGDDQVYTYRARYQRGMVDVTVGYTPGGKIGNLEMVPVESWTSPVQR